MLHPFGGFTRLKREPDNPRAEFRSPSPARALASDGRRLARRLLRRAHFKFSDAGAALSIIASGTSSSPLNLLPGYPLDGVRVLRAFLWRRTGQLETPRASPASAAQLIGGALVVFGGYFYLKLNDPFMGLWFALVGFFSSTRARAIVRAGARRAHRRRRDGRARPVEPETLVSHFVDASWPMHRQTAFAVARDGRLHGSSRSKT